MFIWTAKFPQKKALWAVIFAVLVMAVLFILTNKLPEDPEPEPPELITNEDRVEYLEHFGWHVQPEPVETLRFLLPDPLEEPYLSYNALQIPQGFDLTRQCGKQVTRYTYLVKNAPEHQEDVQVNLYICENYPIAGDLFCAGENGFQLPLNAQLPDIDNQVS